MNPAGETKPPGAPHRLRTNGEADRIPELGVRLPRSSATSIDRTSDGPTSGRRPTSRSISRPAMRFQSISRSSPRAAFPSSSGRPAGTRTRRRSNARPQARGVGVVAAPNFALGVSLFTAMVERAADAMSRRQDFGAWIHELHHAAKRDAPSGTALALFAAMRRAGYIANIDVSSTRAGSIPGTHTIGFDSPAETITLTHTARDRSVFARGALEAAVWVTVAPVVHDAGCARL